MNVFASGPGRDGALMSWGYDAMSGRLRLLPLCMFFAALLVVGCGEGSDPLLREHGSKIAFVSGRDGYMRIYTMNADGSNQQPLTDPEYGEDIHPVWSPDGSRVAFISNDDGERDIHIVEADGTNPRNITNTPAVREESLAWSPDGASIAYTAYDYYSDGGYQLFIMDADGSDIRPLGSTSLYGLPMRLGWSPLGTSLVYAVRAAVGDGGGPGLLATLDADGENRRIIARAPPQFHESPEWSRNGLWIATTVTTPGNRGITVMDGNGENRRAVTHEPWGSHEWPTWSPDGRHIAYAGGRWGGTTMFYRRRYEGRSDIHVVDLDDLSVRKLTDSRHFDGMPAWSPRLAPDGEE